MSARATLSAVLLSCLLLPAGVSLHAQAAGDPVQLTRQTVDEVMADMKTNEAVYEADRAALDAMVQRRLLPRFNFAVMTQLAVGRSWAQASPEQKTVLQNEFRTLLTRTYTNVLFGSRNEKVSIRSNKTSEQGDVIVELEVSSPSGEPVVLAFRQRGTQGEWKVIDVSVDGVSLIVNYRTSFAREISQSGIDALIRSLQQKNRENSE